MEYTKEQLDAIWRKGIVVDGYDPDFIRKDACGAWILRNSYGNLDSDYCWDVDHICPQAVLEKMGIGEEQINNIRNLRPINHKNNLSKASDYPNYRAVTIADGEKNVDCEKSFTVNRQVQAELVSFLGIQL